MWPPLIATISSMPMAATANSPRPSIALGWPLVALGEMYEAMRITAPPARSGSMV
jgi:hypothetical protein